MMIQLLALFAADLSGAYHLTNVREAGSELLLRPNGSFEYMFAYGAADYWAKGTWKAVNDSVVLTSIPSQGESKAFRLTGSSSSNSPAVQVRLVSPGPNPRPVPNIDVTLVTVKGTAKARTDSSGVAMFEKTAAIQGVEFEIRVYGFRSGVLGVNPAHSDFTFEIHGEVITEVRFDAEPLKVDKSNLHMRNWGGGQQEMVYVKNGN